MSLLLLALLVGAVVVVLAELANEIRTDGYGHHEPPRAPSAFDPRLRMP
jgi:hypothetical protein